MAEKMPEFEKSSVTYEILTGPDAGKFSYFIIMTNRKSERTIHSEIPYTLARDADDARQARSVARR